MSIARELHQLLYAHDCVIVPQWGGFLTQYKSARLDVGRSLIHPPSKDLSFNKHLVRNDGVLADHIATCEGLSFDRATAKIAVEVAQWRQTLDEQGRVEIPHIGIFYRDSERNLQFDPDTRANFLKDAYGLTPVVAVKVEEKIPVERKIIPIATEPLPAEKGNSIFWAAAASVALLLGASAFWFFTSGKTDVAKWANANGSAKPEPTYAMAANVLPNIVALPVFSIPENEHGVRTLPLTSEGTATVTVDLGAAPTNAAIPEPVRSTPVVTSAPEPKVEPKATPKATPKVEPRALITVNANKRFHLIGGCFAQPENADKMIGQLQARGFSPVRLPLHKGLHPVAFGSYGSREEAVQALSDLRKNRENSAWLLIR